MLPEQNRLKKKKDFDKVFKKGKGLKQDLLFLKFAPNNLDYNRFGIVVSQKVSKKAAIRNKIRRRLRELIKVRIGELKKGKDIVLIALSGLENKDFRETAKILDKLFKKAKLI